MCKISQCSAKSLQLLSGGLFWLLLLSPIHVSACDLTTTIEAGTEQNLRLYFGQTNKQVVTFVGYSGAGYEMPAAMLTRARVVLQGLDVRDTTVNIGATPEGIGAVYEIAKAMGFATTGIVSTQARKYDVPLSECVDQVFYVEDASWGGYIDDAGTLSPTSAAMVEFSDVLIGIGGGEVARDELIAARKSGKSIEFFPADMSHRVAQKRANDKGLPDPTDFSGAAGKYFDTAPL